MAVLPFGPAQAVEPNPIAAGDFQFEAMFDLSLERDGNIYRTDANKQDSVIARVAPSLELSKETSSGSVELKYDGVYGRYQEDSDDNYADHELSATFGIVNENSRLGASLMLERINEPRGTGGSEGANASLVNGPTEFDRNGFELSAGFGNEDSKSDFELSAQFSDTEFNNFKAINAGRDRDARTLSAVYRYRYSAASSLFLDASHTTLDYSSLLQGFTFDLDGDQTRVHGGLEWSVSQLIVGRLGVGYTRKELDNSNQDFNGISWDLQIEWTPTERDSVLFTTARIPDESQGSGVFQLVTDMQFSWSRKLNPNWQAELYASLNDIELEGDIRSEDVTTVRLSLVYSFSRRMDFAMAFLREEKDSNVATFGYDRSAIMTTVTFAL